jgi:replication factor C subunit 2/4
LSFLFFFLHIGIGKTSSILCLAREMLGETYKKAVLELNASDARGDDSYQ